VVKLTTLVLLATLMMTPAVALAGADSAWTIISHHCSLQIFPDESGIRATDTLQIRRMTSGEDSLALTLLSWYEIASVRMNGRDVPYRHDNSRLVLHQLSGDTVVTLIVSYSGKVDPRSEFSRISAGEATLRAEEVLPSGPKTIGVFFLCVIVPRTWQVYAPGTCVRRSSQRDSLAVSFRLDAVVPSLGWICAGRWTETGDSSVTIALLREDSTAGNALLPQVRDVLKFFSERFSPYRFGSLTVVEIDNWVAGNGVLGIAVPSMILVKKKALSASSRFDRAEAFIPHEIAHQWWPMTVFINDTDAALLSEGMCEYSALLYHEQTGDLSIRDSLQHHPLLRPLIRRIGNHQDVPLRRKADLRSLPTHYLKSCFVHSMLRKVVGDSCFFRLYREWARRYMLQEKSQDDFQHLAEELSGKKLGWFFDQWTGSGGIPRFKLYNVKSAKSADRWITRGRVRLVGYEKFTTPVDVGVETAGGMSRTAVWLGADSGGGYKNDVPFAVITDVKPHRVILDPSGTLLKYQRMPVKISDLRDPGECTMIVGSQDTTSYLGRLARRDSAEMERFDWSVVIKTDREATLADLQQGVVILYGKTEQNRMLEQILPKYPYRVSGDSILIGNESVADSTLALVQAIENPYQQQGMMIWIAPLSALAEPELLPFESSWSILRGRVEISSGTWEIADPDLQILLP
jgi:hypothetical protein